MVTKINVPQTLWVNTRSSRSLNVSPGAINSVVTAATFDHSFKSSTSGPSSCYYFEVYSGATLLATHGSTSTPVSCATTSFVTDHVTLSEVNTDTLANSVVIKVYVKNSGSSKTIDDLDTLTLTYYLD